MTNRKSLIARIDPGTQSNAQSSSKNGMTIYKDINTQVGRILQIGLDAFNWIMHSKYKFPKGTSGRRSNKHKKGRSLF